MVDDIQMFPVFDAQPLIPAQLADQVFRKGAERAHSKAPRLQRFVYVEVPHRKTTHFTSPWNMEYPQFYMEYMRVKSTPYWGYGCDSPRANEEIGYPK